MDYHAPGNHHRVALTYAYELPPLNSAHRILRAAAGGWVVAGTVTIRSGDWLGIGSRCNHNANSAGCNGNYFGGEKYAREKGADFVHPDAARNPTYNTENWGVQWLNPAVFFPANYGPDGSVDPKAGVDYVAIGNTLSGNVRGPSGYYHDMTLTKRFPVTGKVSLEAMVSAFNALNHPVLGNPVTTTDQAAGLGDRFGKINSTAGDPREFQVTFRVRF